MSNDYTQYLQQQAALQNMNPLQQQGLLGGGQWVSSNPSGGYAQPSPRYVELDIWQPVKRKMAKLGIYCEKGKHWFLIRRAVWMKDTISVNHVETWCRPCRVKAQLTDG